MTSIATLFSALAALTALAADNTAAHAVSARVKMACSGDYFSYCSQHSPTSPAVRQCMRTNGPKLSKRCVNALVAAGEVSASEVANRTAAK